ncbi:hypothetical protein Tsubulata_051137 [Turnera subulata]|uniref:NAD-dependent epimerase/dehydratase domain-containing protein n=1 Tax=Turnera subulata TaxID=218843 RepID=A0A9Q0FFQ6_9ROSI|nr:hypothetical protein Tsubulata_051137 [Turnera subulata]
MAEGVKQSRVCVTGGSGFLASWLVNLLLSKSYIVHTTLRDPSDKRKCGHLSTLDKASQNLKLFKADLLDYNSLCSAFEGCIGVFHVASPVPSTTSENPEKEVIEPAVKGTQNVLEACTEGKVRRVVVVSSVAAVIMNPNWPQGQVMDESCWSNKEYCRETKNWYMLSKTLAESEALEYGKRTGLDIVTVCPSMVFGPILQSTVNASSLVLVKLLKEGLESVENKVRSVVDVRDVAEALILVYETLDAGGRYICTSLSISTQDLVEKLKSIYPHYNYPKSFTEGKEGTRLSSEKLRKLGWNPRPLEETLIDSVESYRKAGILDSV